MMLCIQSSALLFLIIFGLVRISSSIGWMGTLPLMRSTGTPASISTANKASVKSSVLGNRLRRYGTLSFMKSKPLVNFLAGGLAGMLSSSLTIPLEVVKTQLQASTRRSDITVSSICTEIMRSSGPIGFFKGLQPLLWGIIPTRAIYFWSYTGTKNALSRTYIKNSSWGHLISACVAGIASNTFSNPIWMVRTRCQILADKSVGQQTYNSYLEAIKSIHKEEGIAGFYKGLTASYVGCLEGAIQWVVYEKLKSKYVEDIGFNRENNATQKDQAIKLFAIAAFSKFSAIVLTYPHEVIRTRMREQAVHGIFKYSGLCNTFQQIAAEEGIRGLYGGIGIHLARSVPNAAIMVCSYELISNWLAPLGTARHANRG